MWLRHPRNERGSDVFAAIILQEMTSRFEFLMWLAGGTGNPFDEFVVPLTEDGVARACQCEERFGPLFVDGPGRLVLRDAGVCRGYLYK